MNGVVSMLESKAGIFAARKSKARDKEITVWKGIVGVCPTKTPMAIPFASDKGSPFRRIKRRYKYFMKRSILANMQTPDVNHGQISILPVHLLCCLKGGIPGQCYQFTNS